MRSYVINFIEIGKDESQFDTCLVGVTTCEDVDGKPHVFESIIDFNEYRGLVEIGGRYLPSRYA